MTAPAKPRSIVATLERARELLADRRTWIKNDYVKTLRSGRQQFCALGAVAHVLGEDGDPETVGHFKDRTLGRRVEDALRAAVPEDFKDTWADSVEGFNDDPRTRHKDVLALYDRAIAARTKKK